VVERHIYDTAYRYRFPNSLRHITFAEAVVVVVVVVDDDDDDMHRFACAVNYILEIWCSYI
jgi:hypothetical protein